DDKMGVVGGHVASNNSPRGEGGAVPPRKNKTPPPTAAATTDGSSNSSNSSNTSASLSRQRGSGSGNPGGGGKYDLVIVESPAKAKTINKYLGGNYRVLASYGHVRDLPKRRKKGEEVAGVDIA